MRATRCYCLHRRQRAVFVIPPELDGAFHDHMKRGWMQTDIYCSYKREDDVLFQDAETWNAATDKCGGYNNLVSMQRDDEGVREQGI
jgi:hypothetical protein